MDCWRSQCNEIWNESYCLVTDATIRQTNTLDVAYSGGEASAIVKQTNTLDVAYSGGAASAVLKQTNTLDVAYSNNSAFLPDFLLKSLSVEVVRSKQSYIFKPSFSGSYTKELRTSWQIRTPDIKEAETNWYSARTSNTASWQHILPMTLRNQSSIPPVRTLTVPTIFYRIGPTNAPIPSFLSPPTASVGDIPHTYGDIYGRVWVIPSSLTFLNPSLGAQSPASLWSAFNVPNTITSIIVSGTPAIANDLSLPYNFDASGSKIVNAIISDDNFVNIETVLTFSFSLGGDKTLTVFSQLLLFDRKIPDVSVEEQYNWLTNIITSYNGTEQRLAIRGAPRRVINATFTLETEDQFRRFQELIYKGNNTSIGAPLWQYAGGLKNNVNIGQGLFQVNMDMTDVRDGDAFMVVDLDDDNNFEVFVVNSIAADEITSVATSTKSFKAFRALIVPLMPGKIQDSSSIRFDTTYAETSLTIEENTGREIFARPFATPNLVELYDGLKVLDRLPLNTANEFAVINNAELIDFDVGKSIKKVNWKHSKKSASRQYVINRMQQNNEFDYWREFLSGINGSQKSFLMPSFNPDLEVDPSSQFFNEITVKGLFFGQYLSTQDSHKRLLIHTNSGVYKRKVVSVATNTTNKTTKILIDATLPVSVNQIDYIEYLLKVRIQDDQVGFTHDINETILSLNVITTDQT
jgi:hypothetical protein